MTETLKKLLKIGYKILIVVGLSVLMGIIMAFPVMLLWNWILPSVTKGLFGTMNVFQAWGLTVLCGILFGAGRGKD